MNSINGGVTQTMRAPELNGRRLRNSSGVVAVGARDRASVVRNEVRSAVDVAFKPVADLRLVAQHPVAHVGG